MIMWASLALFFLCKDMIAHTHMKAMGRRPYDSRNPLQLFMANDIVANSNNMD